MSKSKTGEEKDRKLGEALGQEHDDELGLAGRAVSLGRGN